MGDGGGGGEGVYNVLTVQKSGGDKGPPASPYLNAAMIKCL